MQLGQTVTTQYLEIILDPLLLLSHCRRHQPIDQGHTINASRIGETDTFEGSGRFFRIRAQRGEAIAVQAIQ
ncbi:hypothetical protein D9M69_660880 [compost metagenome]